MTEQQQRAMRDELAWFNAVWMVMVTMLPAGTWVAYYVRCEDELPGVGRSPEDACIDLLGRLGAV